MEPLNFLAPHEVEARGRPLERKPFPELQKEIEDGERIAGMYVDTKDGAVTVTLLDSLGDAQASETTWGPVQRYYAVPAEGMAIFTARPEATGPAQSPSPDPVEETRQSTPMSAQPPTPESPEGTGPADTGEVASSGPRGLRTWGTARQELEIGEAAMSVLNDAVAAVSGSPDRPVTTSPVLFAIADAGFSDRPPEWAGDFLARNFSQAGLSAGDLRRRYLAARTIAPSTGEARADHRLSTNLRACLASAAEIAQATSGSRRIFTRHLLAALIAEPRAGSGRGALKRLREIGVDPAGLRERLLDFVWGFGDNDAEWERVLSSPAPAVTRLPSVHADSPGGRDLIDIEHEVVQLAMLIAAREVPTPLSIGLFGDWGSGKTFFMGCLRKAVDALAEGARNSGRMQREEPFYKRIVQIEFNAWHYVEANLWASLVQHILDNLRVTDDEDEAVTVRLQKRFMKVMKYKAAARDAAVAEEKAALAAAEAAKDELVAAEQERAQKAQALNELAYRRLMEQFALPAARNALAPLLAQLGLEAAGESAAELHRELKAAERALSEGAGVLTPLLHAPDRAARRRDLSVRLVVGPAVALAVGWAVHALGVALLPTLGAAVTSLASGAPLVSRWIRAQRGWVEARVAELKEAQKAYETERALALASTDQAINDVKQRLQVLAAEYAVARERRLVAEQELKDAQKQKARATTTRLLADFVQDRAASTDYRKHLGVLALVRDDFRKISGLITDDNWRLAPERADDDLPRRGLKKLRTLKQERLHEKRRINRIVLYIDDLDRCPPNKVVEVLQAVHLLLAFAEFVVVVGVDARWVKTSLATRYRRLLGDGDRAGDGGLIGRATANDYLEKIFQIPFWLRPMDDAACRRMVNGLLAGSVVREPEATRRPDAANRAGEAGGEGEKPAVGAGGAPSSGPAVGGTEGGAPHDAPAPPSGSLASRVAAGGAGDEGPGIRNLEIRQNELDFIAELAPLLERSPRGLKRFVNVYRLIKVGKSEVEHRAFARPNGAHRTVLFLLALDVGHAPLFHAVRRSAEAESRADAKGEGDAASRQDARWLARLADDPDVGGGEAAERVRRWLEARRDTRFASLAAVLQHGSDVARYSFGAESPGEGEAPAPVARAKVPVKKLVGGRRRPDGSTKGSS